jgi:thiosulfate/3-mercaptopyruvate sulfurtransferase
MTVPGNGHFREWALALAFLVAAACAPGAGSAPREISPGATANGIERGMIIGADSLARIRAQPGLVILHVARARAEFERSRIPGARFLPLGAIVTERGGLPNELPSMAVLDSVFESVGVADDARIVLYGEPLAAARAYFTLDVMGHGDHTALLDGGIPAWRAAGLELASGPAAAGEPPVARLSVRERAGVVVDAAWVAARIDDPAIAVIDARPPAEFAGETPGDGVTRPGHIPGAASLFWKTTIVSDSLPELRDAATLQRLLLAAGAAPGDTVVAYCRTGVQASHVYFVARYLGYEVRMYDGSYLDWARRTELPVARGSGGSE